MLSPYQSLQSTREYFFLESRQIALETINDNDYH